MPASVTESNTAAFSVTATGADPLRYQWRFDGADLIGQTNSQLVLPEVKADQDGFYSVEVSNDFGRTTSAERRLTVNVPPSVPFGGSTPLFLMIGDTLSFYPGDGRTYNWRFNGELLAHETNSSLIRTNIQPDQAGSYELTVRNAAGAGTGTQNVFISAPLPIAWTSQKDLSSHSEVTDLETDRDGNVFATGTLWTTNSMNVIIARYSADGTEKWARIVAVWAAIGRLIMTKFDLNGAELWTTEYAGALYSGEIGLDSADNLFVAVYNWFFGPGDYRLLKIDPLGRVLSFTHFAGTSLPSFGVRTIKSDAEGTVYAGGGWQFNLIAYRAAGSPVRLSIQPDLVQLETHVLALSGDAAFSYTIQKSTDLRDWAAWTNVVNLSGKLSLKQHSSMPALFFRAIQNP